jgi:hypothetical protein
VELPDQLGLVLEHPLQTGFEVAVELHGVPSLPAGNLGQLGCPVKVPVPHQYHKEEAFKLCDRIDASFPGMTRLVSLCHTESVKVTNPTKLFSVFIGLFHQGRSGPSIAVLRTRGTTKMIIAYLLVLFRRVLACRGRYAQAGTIPPEPTFASRRWRLLATSGSEKALA